MKRLVCIFCIFYILIINFIHHASAKDIKVNISGNVIIPPCSIEVLAYVDFPFGEINDAYTNEKPVFKQNTYRIDCGYYWGEPYLTISGPSLPGAPSDILTLRRDEGGESAIGVEFYQGNAASQGAKIVLGGDPYKNKITSGLTNVNSSQSNLTITAKLFRIAGKKILVGSYTGSATMTFSYL
ncbi:fimbrial protein [Erwinia sp. MYb375]|uniref:fimbrial protein n=2 Tax=Erwinia TaxID=551 RepID=UPI0030AF338D